MGVQLFLLFFSGRKLSLKIDLTETVVLCKMFAFLYHMSLSFLPFLPVYMQNSCLISNYVSLSLHATNLYIWFLRQTQAKLIDQPSLLQMEDYNGRKCLNVHSCESMDSMIYLFVYFIKPAEDNVPETRISTGL